MKRNKFSLSHYKLLSAEGGYLIPISCYEVLPGDTVQQNSNLLVRCSPLLAPVMHPLDVKVHHFFVPTRILWDGFEDFITGKATPQHPVTRMPSIPSTEPDESVYKVRMLFDYLGIPPKDAAFNSEQSADISALPFRAYNKIYNEYYRDKDLMNPVPEFTASTYDSPLSYGLLNVAWDKDYFTTARPWAEKGGAASVPLTATGSTVAVSPTTAPTDARNLQSAVGGVLSYSGAAMPVGANVAFGNNSITGRFSALTVSVRDLRLASAVERYNENRAKYGSRYVEYLRYLGVRSSDARLQRPEYLGGGRQTIQFSEVLQTAPGDDSYNDAVGALKGHGIGAVRTNRFRRFFEEHGFVMSLMIIRPRPIYTDGVSRMFLRRTKEDYWQRELEHIGQQPIYDNEVYLRYNVVPDPAMGRSTFGFQDRYSEYRQELSRVSGEFRTVLNYWHMARQFAIAPALNSDFVTCRPTQRVFASQATDSYYVMCSHSIQARRMVAQRANGYVR